MDAWFCPQYSGYSETIVMKRVVHDAYKQIEENIEKFALLNDQIRNPLDYRGNS
jgi:hypothetical protein